MKRTIFLIILLITAMALSACGGGGGGSSPATSTKAEVKLVTAETTALPVGTRIGAIDMTLSLPAGVTVKATPDVQNPSVLVADSGVAVVSGVTPATNTLITTTYAPAQGTTRGTLRILIENADGFGPGEFVTVTGDLAAGIQPVASDFSVAHVAIKDQNSVDISSSLTIGYTVQMR